MEASSPRGVWPETPPGGGESLDVCSSISLHTSFLSQINTPRTNPGVSRKTWIQAAFFRNTCHFISPAYDALRKIATKAVTENMLKSVE